MTRALRDRLAYVLAILTAAVPFAFALIRAIQTGKDYRYFWVALASLLGATMTLAVGRGYRARPSAAAALAAAVFVVATVFAVLGALLIGTRFGPGLLVVGSSFGACFGVAGWFYTLARPREL